MMIRFYKFVFLLIAFSTVLTNASGQRQTLIGLDGIVEIADGELHPGLGVLVERRFTKHSGFEGGLFYKNYNQNGIATIITSNLIYTTQLNVSEHYLSIPLLYKFYTRIINISAGPAFDYYIGFRHKNKSAAFTINSYNINPKLSIGALLKVSKPFNLNRKILLEPELRLNPNFSFERTMGGLGIAAKYKLD